MQWSHSSSLTPTDHRNGAFLGLEMSRPLPCRGSPMCGGICTVTQSFIHYHIGLLWFQYGGSLVLDVCVELQLLRNNVSLSPPLFFVRNDVSSTAPWRLQLLSNIVFAIWMCQYSLFVGQDKLVDVVLPHCCSAATLLAHPHRLACSAS